MAECITDDRSSFLSINSSVPGFYFSSNLEIAIAWDKLLPSTSSLEIFAVFPSNFEIEILAMRYQTATLGTNGLRLN